MASGRPVIVAAEPQGVQLAVPDWMLIPQVCEGFTIERNRALRSMLSLSRVEQNNSVLPRCGD
jgi:hypothetical protein